MKKYLTIFFLIMFVIGTDTFIISPLLPTLREEYGVSVELSGWLVSAYALGYAVFALIVGPISDGLNRKKMMLIGLTLFSAFTIFCGFAPNFWIMVLFRLMAGISAALLTPQVWASIPILLSPKDVLKGLGVATAGLSTSQMIGLPLGTYLAIQNWSTPFIVLGIFSFLLIIPVAIFIPDINPKIQQGNAGIFSFFKNYKALLINYTSFLVFLSYFLFQLGNFASFTFLGTWLETSYELNVSQIGTAMLVLGLGNTVGSLFGSNIVEKIGKSKSLVICIIVLAVYYSMLDYLPNILLVEVVFFFMFLFTGMLFPLLMHYLQSLSSTSRGMISSLSNAVMYGGTTLGGLIGGMLFNYFNGFGAIGFFTSIMFLLSLTGFTASGVLKPIISTNNQKHLTK